MQPVVVENGALFINDAYNAAPTSMRAALAFHSGDGFTERQVDCFADMLELGEEERYTMNNWLMKL